MRLATRIQGILHLRGPAVVVALVAVAAAAPAARGQTTWPGVAPCDGTLQACIAAAASGDVIEVATDGPIAESVEIFGKSLTLRAAAGFTPVFTPPGLDAIEAFGGDVAVTVVIEGLTVEDAFIAGYQVGGGTFDLTIRGNTVRATDVGHDHRGIVVASLAGFGTPDGPTVFEIADNTIDFSFPGGDVIGGIVVRDLAGPTTGAIVGNTIAMDGTGGLAGAVEIVNGAPALAVDVLRNRIDATGLNGGVIVRQSDAAGSTAARVVGNLIVGALDLTGPQPGGISLLVTAGSGDFTVVNNTVADNDSGVVVDGAAGAIAGVLANNVVAGNTSTGIDVAAAVAATFTNDHNLLFGNGPDSFVAGPGTLFADPLFVGGDDYHLQPASPAIDAGDDADVPADVTTDLDGQPRIAGAAVDIGAFEAPPPPGTIQFSSAAYAVPENAGPARITLTRTGGTAGEIAVRFTTSDGTATAGADYTAVDRIVVWGDGDGNPKQVEVPVLDDADPEPDETVDLSIVEVLPLTAASVVGPRRVVERQVGEPSTASLTLVDDDFVAIVPTLSEWALALLAVVLAAAAVLRLRSGT